MKKLLILALAFLPLAATAQDLHESFTVLGEYIPDVIRQDKIHTLPEKHLFTMPATSLPYATGGVAGEFRPSVGVMAPPLWHARLQNAPRGYLDFGMGNYMNMAGSAGYRFVNTTTTEAGIWLQHNSWWGFRPNLSAETAHYHKKLTDDRVGLYLSHTFTAGTLRADVQYHGAWFNYYGASAAKPGDEAPTQTIVNPSVAVNWNGADLGPWAYDATLRYHYLSLRRFGMLRGQKENAVTLGGNVAYHLNERNALALTVNAGSYLYSDPLNTLAASTDYGLLSLIPQYRFKADNLSVTAGADLAMAFHAGRSVFYPRQRDTRVFHAAPHVDLSYTRGIAALSLRAAGGIKANTLQAAAEADLYTAPVLAETTPLYSPVDTRLALTLTPLRALAASLHVDYAVVRGLYPNGNYISQAGYTEQLVTTTVGKVDGFMFGAEFIVTPIERLRLTAAFDYSPQHNDRGYFNGYDRPRWILDATARFSPTDRITVALNYNYRGVRRFYQNTIADGITTTTVIPLRDLTYLNAQASWRVMKPLALWVQVNNILGCRADILPGQPAPGCTFTAGFGLNF